MPRCVVGSIRNPCRSGSDIKTTSPSRVASVSATFVSSSELSDAELEKMTAPT